MTHDVPIAEDIRQDSSLKPPKYSELERWVKTMSDQEKTATLHALMKFHTAPTEGLVASLTERLAALVAILPKTESEDDKQRRRMVFTQISAIAQAITLGMLEMTTRAQISACQTIEHLLRLGERELDLELPNVTPADCCGKETKDEA